MTNGTSSRVELELQKLELESRKLTEEVEALKRAAAPEKWWVRLGKRVVAIGGVVTVLATLLGIYDSYNKTLNERAMGVEVEQRTRFETAITRLEAKDTMSKLVGVSVLSGYLSVDNHDMRRQTLFAMVGLLATEDDLQTQKAVLDLMSSVPVKGKLTADDWGYLQEMLVSQNRALVQKGELGTRRAAIFGSTSPGKAEVAARNLGILIATNARRGVVPNYHDYRGIFCDHCDFAGAVFPDGARFEEAILDDSSFDRVRAEHGNFDNAQLAGTRFFKADLAGATFRVYDPVDGGPEEADHKDAWRQQTGYILNAVRALSAKPVVEFEMPDFSCANLSNASFGGHAIFLGGLGGRRSFDPARRPLPKWVPAAGPELTQFLDTHDHRGFDAIDVRPVKFVNANLSGTDFANSIYFDVFTNHLDRSLTDWRPESVENLTLGVGEIDKDWLSTSEQGPIIFSDDEMLKDPDLRRRLLIDRIQYSLLSAFHGSNWQSAKLDESLRKFLERDMRTLKGESGAQVDCN